MDRSGWDPGRELVAQGAANLASGISGGLPVGGSFGRTALARLAGPRTRWTFVATSLSVALAIPLLPLLTALPVAVLAAIVIVAVTADLRPEQFRFYWRVSRMQFGVAAFTFLATIATAPHIEWGVILGVTASVATHLWRENRVHAHATVTGEELHLRPSGVLYFGSAHRLEESMIRHISEHPEARRLLLHLDGLGRVDVTGALALAQLLDDARSAGLEVAVVDVPVQTRRIVDRVLGQYLPTAGDGDA